MFSNYQTPFPLQGEGLGMRLTLPPAVGNAILDACGADLFENPTTPERVWRAMKLR